MSAFDKATGGSAADQYRLDELMQFKGLSRILDAWIPVSVIGSGSTATVFRAIHRMTGEEAAIKYIPNPENLSKCAPPNTPEDEVNLHYFLSSQVEVRIMLRFRGDPNIIQFLGEPEYLSRSFINSRHEQVMLYAVIICMPLYENSLKWMQDISGSVKKRLLVGIDIARALSIFEKKGVYHRDVKPENILRGKDGRFYLADVGEAKLATSETTIGFRGTFDYMAPEVQQLRDSGRHHSDNRSDIYSLGIVLYRLFNRMQFPFLSGDGRLTENARSSYKKVSRSKRVRDDLPDLLCARELRYRGLALPAPCEADKRLTEIISKACAYSLNARYQSAQDLLTDLLDYWEHGSGAQGRNHHQNQHSDRKLLMGLLITTVVLFALLLGCVAMALSQPGLAEQQASTEGPPIVTEAYTEEVTEAPTEAPTEVPTQAPTATPTATPTAPPTATPTATPTAPPTATPTAPPTATPTVEPTAAPTDTPEPTKLPPYQPRSVNELAPSRVSATTHLKSSSANYDENQLVDGRESTPWQFHITDVAALTDVYVDYELTDVCCVTQLWIKNGFWIVNGGYDQYYRNGRLKTMEISFLYDGAAAYADPMQFTLLDDGRKGDWTRVDLGIHTCVRAVRLRVIEIYPGSKFAQDVAVSELRYVGEIMSAEDIALYSHP